MSANVLEVRIRERAARVGDALVRILGAIDFDVAEGRFVSLVGPSGCGKTTLLRCIAGLDVEYEGEIRVDGAVARAPGLDRGVVFQEPRLLPWASVRSNVAFAISRGHAHEDVDALIDLVGLTGFERHRLGQLSGGMAQRVALARALVNVPRILLMDEPFAALDDFMRTRMQRELRRIVTREQVATLLVTHDIDEAIVLSDEILVMGTRPGTIAERIEVGLDHPRDPTSPEAVALRTQVQRLLSVEPAAV
jgi:ABC-type nitrate/sulfonate/bicarbonate transport system ATPase subunit